MGFVVIAIRPYVKCDMNNDDMNGRDCSQQSSGIHSIHGDKQDLLDAINQTMPFGKYKGRKLIDLPEPYLVWFHSKGFPNSKLGAQLALMYEIKLNGLEGMVRPPPSLRDTSPTRRGG